MMPDAQDLKPIPPTPIILDGISNLVGAYVNGLSKRTQYYSFIDTAKGNSLQQPYQLWFARAILAPLEKAEKKAIADCFADETSGRLYRGILIDDADKVAMAESRFSRCKGWFEDAHKETELFRAYFVLDRVQQKVDIPPDRLEALPKILRIAKEEFEKIYLSYDEKLLESSNGVEDRFQNSLANLLSKPLYWAYVGLDAIAYHFLGIATEYPDLAPRQGLSLRLLARGLNLFKREDDQSRLIASPQMVGLRPLAERQAVKISTWLTSSGFSKVQEIITENGKTILNNATAIALGALLSATIVTRFYPPETPLIDPAFIEAIKGAKFEVFTFKNGDLGIVTYEMPQIPERMRYGEVCRIAWRDVNRSLQRNSTGNLMDLADLRCQEGFLSDPLKAFYDERSQDLDQQLALPDEEVETPSITVQPSSSASLPKENETAETVPLEAGDNDHIEDKAESQALLGKHETVAMHL